MFYKFTNSTYELVPSRIHEAIKANSIEQVKQCIENGENINELNRMRETPLMIAAILGHLPIVKYIVENLNADIDKGKFTALMYACRHNNIEIIKYLHSRGAEINNHQHYYNPLLIATKHNNLYVIKYLVNHGAEISSYCLQYSVSHGYYEVFKYFYKCGHNLKSIMRHVSSNTKPKLFKYLIKINSFIKFINIDKNYYLKRIILKRIKLI